MSVQSLWSEWNESRERSEVPTASPESRSNDLHQMYRLEEMIRSRRAAHRREIGMKLRLALHHAMLEEGTEELDPNWKMVQSALDDLELVLEGS